jgi:hypothetical protein
MKYIFGLVYVLVLATQLPHIWSAYANLEDATIPLAQWTALGAAVAFELSIGVFTYRIIKGNRRTWTRRGLLFFIAASVVANASYYQVWPWVFDWLMPVFATLALPVSLALFAEEFGTEVKREERIAQRLERRSEQPPEQPPDVPNDVEQSPPSFTCSLCGRSFGSRAALSGHGNAHRTKGE